MTDSKNTQRISADFEGLRLDKWLQQQFPNIPYGTWARFCRKGNIRLEGKRVTGAERVKAGQLVRIPPLDVLKKATVDKEDLRLLPLSKHATQELESWILYEDAEILCFNKPMGLATQGGTKTFKHMDGLLRRWALEKEFTPKLVHRLDRDTSGVLFVAKTAKAARDLGRSFKNHLIEKYYIAIVVNVPTPLSGTIDASIEKGVRHNKEKMIVSNDGARAVTHYHVLEKAGKKIAVLALSPVSGRTHQLRVHLEHIGSPILGDPKYGGADQENLFPEHHQTLHLHSCLSILPRSGKDAQSFHADFPSHFQKTLKDFGFSADEIIQDLKELISTKSKG
jgi:23S rRNA pseudouridine955/2504/2580 synthase